MSTYSDRILSLMPLAYYRLGEASGTTMNDSSGNSRNGTYTSVTLGAASLVADTDTAGSFNGTSSDASVPNGLWMDVDQAFTVEAWIKTNATGYREIAAQYATTSNRAWEFRLDTTAGALNFIKLAGGTTSSIGTTSIRDNAVHYVVATYDGSNIKLYVDAALNQTTPSTGSMVGTTANLHIGNRTGTQYFSGIIDEIALYGYVLSAAQIADTYSVGTSGVGVVNKLTGTWGLVS